MELPIDYAKKHHSIRRKARLQYIKEQDGNCWYCDAPLTSDPANKVRGKSVKSSLFPTGFFNHPVHLHHSRVTGLTIGAVHAKCNAVLWQYHGE